MQKLVRIATRCLPAALFLMAASVAQAQIYDSTGQPNTAIVYGDAVYSSTWDRVAGKPATFPTTWAEVAGKPAQATRWPTWNEVTAKPSTFPSTWSQLSGKPSSYPTTWANVSGKPSTFPAASHNHDDRYVRKGASGAISGNLSVSGTVTGNRLVTGDVGGDRWCRANTSGRIQCTHSAPSAGGGVAGGGRQRTGGIYGKTDCGSRWGVATCDGATLVCPSGYSRRTTSSFSESKSKTQPGCDGGCHIPYTQTTAYYICVK